jgi:hypothetical protein
MTSSFPSISVNGGQDDKEQTESLLPFSTSQSEYSFSIHMLLPLSDNHNTMVQAVAQCEQQYGQLSMTTFLVMMTFVLMFPPSSLLIVRR